VSESANKEAQQECAGSIVGVRGALYCDDVL
jgi:hypothetical protein